MLARQKYDNSKLVIVNRYLIKDVFSVNSTAEMFQPITKVFANREEAEQRITGEYNFLAQRHSIGKLYKKSSGKKKSNIKTFEVIISVAFGKRWLRYEILPLLKCMDNTTLSDYLEASKK